MAEHPATPDATGTPPAVRHALDQLAAVRTAIEDMGLPAPHPKETRERVAALAERSI